MVSAPPRQPRSLAETDASVTFRLRHALGILILAGAFLWVYPRGVAAWRLHNLAVTYADYGLCMVGPTGPELLRDDPMMFRELLRRRVLISGPGDRPFSACQDLAFKMNLEHRAASLHNAQAMEFEEYHHSPHMLGYRSLQTFAVDVSPLEQLAERAWPFVRSGAAKLMKASSHAREAAHPTLPPAPGWGSGLPDRRFRYRSTAAFGNTFVTSMGSGANATVLISKDRGQNWSPGGTSLATELRDRCVADDEGRAFTLSRLGDGRHIVLSQGPSAAPQVSVLGSGELKVAGVSCDASALAAVLVEEPDATGYRPVQLRLCPFRRPCTTLEPPDMAETGLYYPVDIARIDGDIVLARMSGGVTRVASSRDGGRTWMPWIVAFDSVSSKVAHQAPFRLLAVADLVLLYSGGASTEPYPLLLSEDHGASFLAPKRPNEPAGHPVARVR